jgi:adenylate kinase
MNLLIIGPPGSGKGTMGSLISSHYQIPVLSTGDVLRKEIKKGTALGKLAGSLIDKGLFVPDDVISNIVKNSLSDYPNGFLLDGFPRSIEQTKTFERILKENNQSIDKVLALIITNEIVVQRLSGRIVCGSCGNTYHEVNNPPKTIDKCNICNVLLERRKDDSPEFIQKRLDIYEETTKPIIEFYEEKGILHKISSDCLIEEQFNQIKNILG